MGERRGRGEGSVRRMANGTWRARWSYIDATGERRRPSAYFPTKREAQAWLAEQRTAQSKGVVCDAAGLTVGDWLDKWLGQKKGQVSESTYLPFESHTRLHLKPILGRLPLVKLRPVHVSELYQ